MHRPPPRPGRGMLAGLVCLALAGAVGGCDRPASPAAELHERAVALAGIGEDAAARDAVEAALAIDPRHAPSLVLHGRLLAASGDGAGAFAAFRRAAEADEAHAPAYLELGRMMLAAGEFGEALRYAGAARRLAPRDPEVLALRAMVSLACGNAEGARTAAEAAVAAGPDSAAARLALAAARKAAEGPEAALAALVAAPQIPDPAVQAMTLELLDGLGRRDSAIGYVRGIVTLAPGDGALRAMLARRYLAAGLPETARGEFRAAARLRPADREVVGALARLAFAEEGVEGALAELDRLGTRPNDGDGATVREIAAAEVEALAGDMTAAAARLLRLAEEAPAPEAPALAAAALAELAAAGRDAALAGQALRLVEAAGTAGEAEVIRVATHAVAAGAAREAAASLSALRARQGGTPALLVALAGAQVAAGEEIAAAGTFAEATAAAAAMADGSGQGVPAGPWLARAEFELGIGRPDLAAGTIEAGLEVAEGNLALLRALALLRVAEGEREGALRILRAILREGAGGGAAAGDDGETGPRVEAATAILARLAESAAAAEAAATPAAAAGTADVPAADVPAADVPAAGGAALAAVAAAAAETVAFSSGATAPVILAAEIEALRGRPGEAVAALTRLAAERPGEEAGHLALVRLLVRLDRPEEALTAASRGIAMARSTLALRQARAAVLERLERPGEALADYEVIYRSDPASVVAANNLASLLAEVRSDPAGVARAAAIARRFARAEDPHLRDTYGRTLFLTGRKAEALPVLEAAAAALPSNPVVQYHLAVAYGAAGRGAEARATLERALSLDFTRNFRYLRLIEQELAAYVSPER